MSEEEANSLSSCGYGCHIIGGPWISFNPSCPEHGYYDNEMVQTKIMPEGITVKEYMDGKRPITTKPP